ncbi:PAS domain-containing protein [Burkholderia sp. Ac-20384]|uniref:sensor histidine kinase n=1 Tax=Burkholderia sp. Ac-20384 TaxID=2703902 RepID=UPI001982177A|nr:PAS domain-containing sensor histidine kinase [Burkholderia sp. Ac-20384]MBN3827531.1 PAS domain-containing protein [Burkholderia sp. Ac-20384]
MDDDRLRSERSAASAGFASRVNVSRGAMVLGDNVDEVLQRRQRVVYLVATLLGVCIFIADAFTPIDVAVAVLYVVVVLLVASVASQPVTVAVAWSCVSLTVLGFLLAQSDQTAISSLARCGLSVLAIVTVSALALRNQSSRITLQKQIVLLNLTHDAVVMCGLDGRISFWSRGAERLYGWSAAEAVGKELHGLTATESPLPLADLLKMTIQDGSWEGEFARACKNGTKRIISSRWTVSRDKSGDPVAILSTDSDVTQARFLEAELRQQKEELIATIDAIPGMVWSTSNDGRIVYLNRRWSDCGVEITSGKDVWRDIIHAEDIGVLEAAWRQGISTGSSFEVTVRVRLGNGDYRCMIIGAAPMRDADGKIVRWYGVNTDIEERRLAEQALERSRSELAHVTRLTMLGELAASIAHEVTQPLAAIVTAGEAGVRWLKRTPPNLAEVQYALGQMTHDAKRATQVIRQIRTMAQRRDPDPVSIDLVALIEQSVDLVRRELQSHHVEVSLSFSQSLLWITGDRVQIQQVLINLLMNAIQAMIVVTDRTRRLSVAVQRCEGDQALVAIEDSGHGISEADASMLFTPFFTTKKEGMGMGLSICRSIVDAHGGRIWAESREQKGTTMRFVLPINGEVADE